MENCNLWLNCNICDDHDLFFAERYWPAGESFGVFYTQTWAPGLILAGGLVMHLSYGLALALSLKVAGVRGPATIG